ncbi:MAG TPA: ABC transporter ATP-binding protein [Chitinophagales bacterium]|nr:ABC transporter ATP-binding protein [Chitinophagales bacterium]
MKKAVEISNVSKMYHLGEFSSSTIKDDLSRWWQRMRGKGDPMKQLAAGNQQQDKIHWALRNVSFDVKEGEVLGIIGKNGAGKSTLLKIISRVTAPTSGSIKIHGRIASLLEVGTGFHPDLSGRENIYQNGAILGMQKAEIDRKLDEIIDFSGVERFIDTPVKRYSSGMYVRLAFAVAAHLEPEILIVDEVLAVGDVEFQKKCLGKISDISTGQGRTVIFVSHNMTAVQSLCSSAVLLKGGALQSIGKTADIINDYLNIYSEIPSSKLWTEDDGPGNDKVTFRHVRIIPEGLLTVEDEIAVDFSFNSYMTTGHVNISLHLYTLRGDLVFATVSPQQNAVTALMHFTCIIPGNFLNDETYLVTIMVVNEAKAAYVFEEALKFEVNEVPRESGWLGKWPGLIRPTFEWKVSKSEG